jgi:hypothetical protein
MRKGYFCLDCGTECLDPFYLRLNLTKCGWVVASRLPRWQRSIPVGHFCEECLLLRVRTATDRDFKLAELDRHSRRARKPARVRTPEQESQ